MKKTALFALVLGCALSTKLMGCMAGDPTDVKNDLSASAEPVAKDEPIASVASDDIKLSLADATTAETVVPVGMTNNSCREDCHDEWLHCRIWPCSLADDPMEAKICYMDCRNELNDCYHGC